MPVRKDGWTMLDIGCGGGATLQRLLKRREGSMVYGIDISEESVAKARKVNAEVLDDAGFIHTEIHRMKPSNATIIGVKA